MATHTAIALSNSLLSLVVAEVIVVIFYNLQRDKMFSPSTYRRQQTRRPYLSVIGSAVPLLLAIALLSPTTTPPLVVEALSVASPPQNNVIAITHAAGRMGKVLALQLREDAALRYQSSRAESDDGDSDETMEAHLPKIRAIVRSKKEAYSVQCDLGGMKMVSGCVAQPIPVDWLETVIIDSETEADERASKLRQAFEGCRAAILCDASHNELVWMEECDVDEDESETDYTNCGFSIVVPASESRDLSRRLLEEIDATSHSTTLEHVVLRSTMGLAVSRAAEANRLYLQQNPSVPFEGEIDWEALARAMGGEAALAGPRNAERAFARLAETCANRKHTILRLGALTDDAGMVPLVFGSNDSILVKTTDDGTKNNRPPILSRADAARVSTVLVRPENTATESAAANSSNLLTVDCAWHPKYGRDSVGREETIAAAARQNLNVRAILESVPEAESAMAQ
jgi:hypothetical protein